MQRRHKTWIAAAGIVVLLVLAAGLLRDFILKHDEEQAAERAFFATLRQKIAAGQTTTRFSKLTDFPWYSVCLQAAPDVEQAVEMIRMVKNETLGHEAASLHPSPDADRNAAYERAWEEAAPLREATVRKAAALLKDGEWSFVFTQDGEVIRTMRTTGEFYFLKESLVGCMQADVAGMVYEPNPTTFGNAVLPPHLTLKELP